MSDDAAVRDAESLSLAPSSTTPNSSDIARSDSSQMSSASGSPQENVDLEKARQHWRQLMAPEFRPGDSANVIASSFIDRLFESPASSVAELRSLVGKIDNSAIVDIDGNLFPEQSEPVPTTYINPQLYEELATQFGAIGTPVVRAVIADQNGGLSLERFAPFFIVHTLTKGTVATRATSHSKTLFLLSQTKTFRELKESILSHLYKIRPPPMRVWFITSENVEDLPAAIPVPVFINKIQHKKLVGPKVLDSTLQSQGIRSSRLHLVAEVMDKPTRSYPVDIALAATDINLLDFDSVVSSGGNLGLSNLGNTCYMNSALQCLVHLPEVNYYFFFDLYEKELNRTNPLGNKGEVAIAFSNLLHKLFDFGSSVSYVTPREFKYTLGRYSSMFHGYQQQDSQEFLSWLLDALHEDLNRIHNKPYCEKPELKDEDVNNPQAIVDLANQCWHQHKLRNDSIIVDLFTGLYESTLVCPECDKKSVTFDPFNDLTLPLPVNKKWYHEFTIVDLSNAVTEQRILKLEVELTKSSNYDDLLTYLSSFLKTPKEDLFLFEIFRNLFYKDFQENGNRSSFMPITELISDSDTVVVYIIPHNPETDIIVPVINVIQDEDKSYNIKEAFGIPLFVVLNKETDLQSFGKIRRKLEQTVKLLTRADLESAYNKIKGESKKKFYAAEDFPLLKKPAFEDTVMVYDSSETSETAIQTRSQHSSESDGYDSDISLADPRVSASFGFEIKYYEEDPHKRHQFKGVGSRFGRGGNTQSENQQSIINVPHGRPQFDNLKSLASKLSQLKHNYYHYPEFAAQIESAAKGVLEQEIAVDEDDKNGYVLVDHAKLEEAAPSDDGRYSLPDEETDSDSNWDNMNTLFTSVDRLGPIAPPMSDSDREANSDVPSPQEKGPVKVDNHDALVGTNTTFVLDWDADIYSEFFKDPDHQLWENLMEIPNPVLEANKRKLALQQKSTVSLYDCLRNFSTPEVLGDQDLWYCPRCKEHRRATKTIQIWSTGDILTIHLKRFQSARSFSDKINMVVDFPIEGLDMSEFVMSNQESNQDLIYDLVAVDNHYGGLGGGHYTASGKNFRDNKWYYFNDGRVTQIEDPKECVTGAAYLLFYKKRSSTLLAGGDAVKELLNEGRRSFEAKLLNLKELLLQVMEEIEENRKQEAGVSAAEALKKKEEDESSSHSDDDDLYGDNDGEQHAALPEAPQSKATKKSRSPMAEQAMEFEFENQRKQRLILKDVDLPRSVNINVGYSSSVSNLASPTGSVDDGDLD